MKFENKITKKLNGDKECWRNSDLLWISIPKNANTQFRSICENLGAKRQKLNLKNLPELIFCVWRNPRTRLVSGIGEYYDRPIKERYFRQFGKRAILMQRPTLSQGQYTEYLEKLYRNPYHFDEHLEPQIVYAQGLKYSHVLRFEQLIDDIQTIEMFKGNPHLYKNLEPQRTTTSQHTKNFTIDDVINDNNDLIDSIIKKYYSEDLDIYHDFSKILK
jgi:hypothetical protein